MAPAVRGTWSDRTFSGAVKFGAVKAMQRRTCIAPPRVKGTFLKFQ